MIDARSNTAIGRIALGGEAGNTHYDAVSHCIVVAVQTKNELVAIDPASERIVARYRMACDHPHGFLIDEPNRLAFVTCEGDAKLLVVDLRTMRTTATLRTAGDPDVLALDPGIGDCTSGAKPALCRSSRSVSSTARCGLHHSANTARHTRTACRSIPRLTACTCHSRM